MEYGIHDYTYEPGNEVIKTAVFGDGSVMVGSLACNYGGFVGVMFAPARGEYMIGEYESKRKGKPIAGLGTEFIMTFDNPDSIDVVIAALESAKEELILEQSKA